MKTPFKCLFKYDSSSNYLLSINFARTFCDHNYISSQLNSYNTLGSPARVSVQDPGQISVTGEGLIRGTKGEDSVFSVNSGAVGGNIKVDIEGT